MTNVSEYKIEWKKVPAWMRFGLNVARVQKPLVTAGELSPNEIENLAKFGYVCIIVTLVAFGEIYCFWRYAVGMWWGWSSAISFVWAIVVFNADRSLFRDKLDKSRIRIVLILVATVVFSLGISVLISDIPLTNTITQENIKRNEEIDKSLLANLKPYQDRLNDALRRQSDVNQSIVRNDLASTTSKDAAAIQAELSKYAGDTTAEGKRRERIARDALYTVNQGLKKQANTEKDVKGTSSQAVTDARSEFEAQRRLYEKAYTEQRQPPDYSESNKTLTLIRKYFDVGAWHIFILFLIAFVESFPLIIRYVYRDYDVVPLMIGLSNTPFNKYAQRIKTLREEIEEAKRMRDEQRYQQKNEEKHEEDNPFRDAF